MLLSGEEIELYLRQDSEAVGPVNEGMMKKLSLFREIESVWSFASFPDGTGKLRGIVSLICEYLVTVLPKLFVN